MNRTSRSQTITQSPIAASAHSLESDAGTRESDAGASMLPLRLLRYNHTVSRREGMTDILS